MKVFFDARNTEGTRLRELVESRARFVFRRLGWLVTRVTARMTDVNGPRGGVDKQCRIQIDTGTVGTIIITSAESDYALALETGLARANLALTRAHQRSRRHARTPVRPELFATENGTAA